MPFKLNVFTGQLDLVGATGAGSGDVTGPSSSDDKAIARFDGTTGKLIQNSPGTFVQDSGAIEASGFMTRRSVTTDVTVKTGESWIAPSIELALGGSIVIESDAEIIIV